jgi:hypothetical protein
MELKSGDQILCGGKIAMMLRPSQLVSASGLIAVEQMHKITMLSKRDFRVFEVKVLEAATLQHSQKCCTQQD